MSKVNVRELNTKKVVQAIFNNQPIFRSEISKKLGINKVTVSEIFDSLMEKKIIVEIGQGESTRSGGRKPMMVNINPNFGYTVSIDFAYDYLDFMINRISGEIISTSHIDTSTMTIMERIDTIKEKINSINLNTINGLLGISVAFHGVIYDNKIIYSPQLDIGSIDIYQELQKMFSVPIILENEANLSAVYERDFVDDYDEANLVCISIHRGVGAGIILNNKLYRGTKGQAGEIGHLAIPNSKNKDITFEDYCSERVILSRIRKLKANKKIDFKDIALLYKNKDEDVISVLTDFKYYLALLTQTVMLSYDPQKIVYNSHLLQCVPGLFDNSKNPFEDTPFWPRNGVSLIGNVDEAILLGGCSNITRKILKFDDVRITFGK